MQTYTTDAAKACNVSLNTIRNWCRDYGAFLSPGASATGEARAFTGRDMEVLKYIALLRSEGMQKGAIVQRLGETTFSEIAPDDTIEPAADSEELATQNAPESLQSTQAIIMVVESLRSEVKAIQEARRFDAVGLVGLGIVIGLVFATMFIALASLYGGSP